MGLLSLSQNQYFVVWLPVLFRFVVSLRFLFYRHAEHTSHKSHSVASYLKKFKEVLDGEIGLEAVHTFLRQLVLFFTLRASDLVVSCLLDEILEAAFAVRVQARENFGGFISRKTDGARQFFVDIFGKG